MKAINLKDITAGCKLWDRNTGEEVYVMEVIQLKTTRRYRLSGLKPVEVTADYLREAYMLLGSLPSLIEGEL